MKYTVLLLCTLVGVANLCNSREDDTRHVDQNPCNNIATKKAKSLMAPLPYRASKTTKPSKSEGIAFEDVDISTPRSETESTTEDVQEMKAIETSDTTTPKPETPTQSANEAVVKFSVSKIEEHASSLMNIFKDPTLTEANISEAVQLVDEVLKADNDYLIKAQKNHNISTNLLYVENLLTKSNLSLVTYNTSQFWASACNLSGITNIAFQISSNKENTNKFNGTLIIPNANNVTPTSDFDAFVSLNVAALPSSPGRNQMAFVYHPTVRLADAALTLGFSIIKVHNPSNTNNEKNETFDANCTAAGGLVQVALSGGSVHLSSPMDLYFKPNLPLISNKSIKTHCVYWNPDITINNGTGGWSTYGCQYKDTTNTLIHCQCNHFSAFTVLFAYSDEPSKTRDDEVLDWVTKIGCSLSIIGMASVIFTYILIPQCRKTRRGFYGHHLIFHLSVALTTLLITFLAGFEQTDNPAKCLGIAMLLHYFTLVVFFWMLVESYYYYTLFVRVKTIKNKHFLRNAGIFAWGIPFFIVLSTASFDTELYFYEDSTKYCWLRKRGFLYALLPFVFAILLVNATVYGLIMRKVGCRMRQPAKSINIGSQPTLSGYSIVVMFFILGLSWIFGLLAIGVMRGVFSYLFCIFNSLQGFVIFPLFLYHAKAGRK